MVLLLPLVTTVLLHRYLSYLPLYYFCLRLLFALSISLSLLLQVELQNTFIVNASRFSYTWIRCTASSLLRPIFRLVFLRR